MARVDLIELFEACDPDESVHGVKHDYTPQSDTKMDGASADGLRAQELVECGGVELRPSRRQNFSRQTLSMRERGLWLHQFSWLHDDDIGELDPCWNHLVGDKSPEP